MNPYMSKKHILEDLFNLFNSQHGNQASIYDVHFFLNVGKICDT